MRQNDKAPAGKHYSTRAILNWIWQFVSPYKSQTCWAVIFLFLGSVGWRWTG